MSWLHPQLFFAVKVSVVLKTPLSVYAAGILLQTSNNCICCRVFCVLQNSWFLILQVQECNWLWVLKTWFLTFWIMEQLKYRNPSVHFYFTTAVPLSEMAYIIIRAVHLFHFRFMLKVTAEYQGMKLLTDLPLKEPNCQNEIIQIAQERLLIYKLALYWAGSLFSYHQSVLLYLVFIMHFATGWWLQYS